jgi:hypothetical protein
MPKAAGMRLISDSEQPPRASPFGGTRTSDNDSLCRAGLSIDEFGDVSIDHHMNLDVEWAAVDSAIFDRATISSNTIRRRSWILSADVVIAVRLSVSWIRDAGCCNFVASKAQAW